MKKALFLLVTICSFSLLSAQIVVSDQVKNNKWRVGGNVGLGFGGNSFGFSLSPFAGYAINNYTELGLAAGYDYNKVNDFKTNILSIGPYANIYPAPMFFLRAHYEYLNGTQKNSAYRYTYNFDESALWLGAGYQSTGRIRFQTGLMYNVLFDEGKSIYSSGLRPFAGISYSL